MGTTRKTRTVPLSQRVHQTSRPQQLRSCWLKPVRSRRPRRAARRCRPPDSVQAESNSSVQMGARYSLPPHATACWRPSPREASPWGQHSTLKPRMCATARPPPIWSSSRAPTRESPQSCRGMSHPENRPEAPVARATPLNPQTTRRTECQKARAEGRAPRENALPRRRPLPRRPWWLRSSKPPF
jgi:hypothetical protein